MQNFKNFLKFITLFMILILTITGCSGKKETAPAKEKSAEKQIVMKFSHVVSPDTTKGKTIQYFADLVEKYTDGKAKVQVFPSGQLYGDKEEVEAIMSGNVELVNTPTVKLTTLEPSYNVWSLFFLFPNINVVHKFIEDPDGWGKLNKKLEEKTGLMELGAIPTAIHWFNSKHPINSPEDLKGLKLRTIGGAVMNECVVAIGGSSIMLPFGETYNALQLGTVDGGETNLGNIYTMKFYEVSKFLTLSSHYSGIYPILINKKFYDKLPADIQEALKRAGKEAQKYGFEIDENTDREMLEKIKASGKVKINELTPEQREAFEKKVQPVWEKHKKVIGEDIFQKIMEIRKN